MMVMDSAPLSRQRPTRAARASACASDTPLACGARRIWSGAEETVMENCSVGVSGGSSCLASFLESGPSTEAQAVASAARQRTIRVRITGAGLFDDITDGSLISLAGDGGRRRLVGLVHAAEQRGLGVVGDLEAIGGRLQVCRAGRVDQGGGDHDHQVGLAFLVGARAGK